MITIRQRHILHLALGINRPKRERAYRNHLVVIDNFFVRRKSPEYYLDERDVDALRALGYLSMGATLPEDGATYYHVTPTGRVVAEEAEFSC